MGVGVECVGNEVMDCYYHKLSHAGLDSVSLISLSRLQLQPWLEADKALKGGPAETRLEGGTLWRKFFSLII